MADPVVTIGGKTYNVPPLVFRQVRIVHPVLLKMMSLFRADANGKFVIDYEKLSTQMYDEFARAIFWGILWPNDRKLSEGEGLAQIMDMNLQITDMFAALSVIRDQSGMFVKAQEGATPGE